MGRSKKFMYNSITTALLQVVTMIAGFITPRFMLTAYGSEINGLVSSILQFISYFNLVEAGLSSAAVFSLYKPIADHDHGRINSIVAAAKHFYIKSGFIFVGLVVALAFCFIHFITSSTVLDQKSIFASCPCIRSKWFFGILYVGKIQSFVNSGSKDICYIFGFHCLYGFKYSVGRSVVNDAY